MVKVSVDANDWTRLTTAIQGRLRAQQSVSEVAPAGNAAVSRRSAADIDDDPEEVPNNQSRAHMGSCDWPTCKVKDQRKIRDHQKL